MDNLETIGIVIGIIAGLLAIIGFIWKFFRQKPKTNSQKITAIGRNINIKQTNSDEDTKK